MNPHLGLPFLLIAAILSIAAVTFLYAREQASRSVEGRRMIVRRALLGVGVGLLVAFGSWNVLPTNPESPAMILTYFVSFVIGGGLTFYSVLALIAALTAATKGESVE